MQNFKEFDLDEARMSAALRMANAIDKQRAKSDASRGRTPSSIPKKEEPKKGVAKGLKEDNEHYEAAEEHLSKANDAEAKGHMKSFHAHMADHHDAMSEWHDSKGRSASADKHADKAEMHHEKSLTVKEDNDLNEDRIPKNHTIEAHGIRGMKATPWRKTFKNHEHLSDWADKNDSVEVHATRDLEQAKKDNLSPAMREEALLDKFKKYVRPVVKTTPKIERDTNPSGRTNDHVEWKVTTHTGEVHRHNSKKEAQAHFDSLPK